MLTSEEERREQRHLKRVDSWKQGHKKPLDEEALREMEAYFRDNSRVNSRSHSRRNSIDSLDGCEEVYEVKDVEDISFVDDDEAPLFDTGLSYNPYVNPNAQRGGGKPLLYELRAVIQHSGTGFGGHYVCYRRIKTKTSDKWYMMNDSIVREVQWSDVNTKNMWVRNGRFRRSYLVVYDAIETVSSLCSTNMPAKAKALQSIRHHLNGKMNIRTCFFHHWSV